MHNIPIIERHLIDAALRWVQVNMEYQAHRHKWGSREEWRKAYGRRVEAKRTLRSVALRLLCEKSK